MDIQVCRLPALLQPTGTPGPYINGFSPRPRINGFLWASKSAVCQPSCSQQAPQGHTSMASYGRPSLPFASPQTLKTLQTLQTLQTLKTIQTLKNRKTLKTLTWHASSCSQPPPQGHTSMASYGHPSLPFASPLAANRHPRAIHQWLLPKATHQWLLMGIQVCRLPALLQPTGTPGPYINGFSPRPHINGFLWASKSAVCQPSCSQQAPQGHTSMASYGSPSLPFARPKTLQTLKTIQTLQTLKILQTLKNRKILKTLTSHASSCSQQPPRATHQWLLMATLVANRHPRATHHWLLMGVQVCRLPALKPLKPTHQWLLMGIQVCRLPALLQPTGTPGPHINGFLWASKSAVCPP